MTENKVVDGKLISKNINLLAKEAKIKIGDLENNAGVTAGYFSRFLKDENTSIPSLDAVASVASQLNVPIDYLINVDHEFISPTEKYLIKMLKAFCDNTKNEAYHWEREPEIRLKNAGFDSNGNPRHPLGTAEMEMADETNENSLYATGYLEFESKFTTKNMVLSSDILKMNHCGSIIYLCKVHEYHGTDKDVYELYLLNDYRNVESLEPICASYPDNNPIIIKYLKELYIMAVSSAANPKISKESKDTLDRIMNDLPF